MKIKQFILGALLLFGAGQSQALPYAPDLVQEEDTDGKMQFIQKGNFESWTSQTIKESRLLGGKTINLMHIGAPWGSSNVWAKVSGVTKTNISVYKDSHPGHGNCVKLYTHIVEAKVLGIINIKVLAAGSIFLGNTIQPITDTKNPMAKLNAGVKFSGRPKALVFDYKAHIVPGNRIRQNGITKGKTVPGQDMADCILYLQKRWEDEKGNIYAKRVGTMVVRYYTTTDWHNNATYSIMYGDITGDPAYKAHMMRLQVEERYAVNSKGESVPIKEVAWGTEDDVPTHLLLQFTSSHGGAYIGSPGNSLWIDNVKLVY